MMVNQIYVWRKNGASSFWAYPPHQDGCCVVWRRWVKSRNDALIEEVEDNLWTIPENYAQVLWEFCINQGWVWTEGLPPAFNKYREDRILASKEVDEVEQFGVFFLLPTAPQSVFKSAYRTLAKESKDDETLKRLNVARDEIRSLRGWS